MSDFASRQPTLIQGSEAALRRVRPLFAGDYPVPIRLWAMLDGVVAGRLLVDSAEEPAYALLQEQAEGTVYIGGEIEDEALVAAMQTLRQFQDFVICQWLGSRRAWPSLPEPDYEGVAIDFTDRSPAVDLGRLAVVPPPYELRRIEPELVPLLAGFDYYVQMFGDLAAAQQGTAGCCVLYGGEVVSEAVAGPFARGVAEIGVGTQAAHQGKGLATAAAAGAILLCEASGCRPLWNAAQQNSASVALARRLGFRTEQPFQVLVWSHTDSALPL